MTDSLGETHDFQHLKPIIEARLQTQLSDSEFLECIQSLYFLGKAISRYQVLQIQEDYDK